MLLQTVSGYMLCWGQKSQLHNREHWASGVLLCCSRDCILQIGKTIKE